MSERNVEQQYMELAEDMAKDVLSAVSETNNKVARKVRRHGEKVAIMTKDFPGAVFADWQEAEKSQQKDLSLEQNIEDFAKVAGKNALTYLCDRFFYTGVDYFTKDKLNLPGTNMMTSMEDFVGAWAPDYAERFVDALGNSEEFRPDVEADYQLIRGGITKSSLSRDRIGE